MTNKQLKFYKLNSNSSKLAGAKAVEGAIIYVVDVNELWIGGSTAANAKLVLKGANDVTFADNVLTLTHYNNAGVANTQTLDFSDVASASSMMHVFEQIYTKMGLTGQKHDTLDYTGTNYLTSATNLVDADKILDGKIYENSIMGVQSSAVYDTQHLSSTWTEVVNANAIQGNNTVRDSVEKVDKKVAQLANEVINNKEVTQQAFSAVANSVGLESDMSLDLSAATLNVIKDDTSVKEALIDLDAALHTITSDAVKDVKINGTSIVNSQEANIAVDGTYNATDNKIATQSTVSDAINALDVNTDKGAASISGSTITINAVKQENGLITDGGSTTINLDGTYNATDNKIATKSTVTSAIEALDTQSDVHDVVYTEADASNGAKLTFKGVSETDGVIAQGSGATKLQFAKVATTGAAADVSIADTPGKITATNVEDALTELATNIENLAGGMRYNGDIDSATATLNTSTHDIRPGDIYLASGAFSIGSTSVEAGDMIVYKGTTSTEPVDLTESNCTIIERETDTMVTAGNTLEDDYIVFGNGNKEVTTTSTVESANYTVSAATLKDAITKANSALQSISRGSDGTYVTTTIGAKDSNNDQKVSVAVTQSTVAYAEKSGDTPANLTATNGLLNETAIPQIKSYVDAKVGTAVQSVDGSATEKAKTVTQSDYAAVKVTASTDANKNVTLDTVVGLTVQAVSSADSTHKGLAEASDVKTYVDGKITDLDGSATIASVNNNVVTIKTGVTETDGIISNTTGTTDIVLEEVAVTGAASDVSYNNQTSGMTATTVQAAIDELKTGLCWEEYEYE